MKDNTKKNLKFFAGCLISAAIIFLIVQILGKVLDPYGAGEGFAAVEAFHSLEENSLDVIIYGSSHAWKGCDTRVMHDRYGLEAYNYGCDWQAINTVLLFLRDSLRTQNPKVVCVETFLVNSLMQNWDMEGQIYYTKAMGDFPGRRTYLKQAFAGDIGRYLSYYVPLVMFHDNWSVITSENFEKPDPGKYVLSRGYRESQNVAPCHEPDYENFEQEELYDDCRATLDEIVKECEDRGISLIFYTAPCEAEYHFNDAMKEYVKDKNCVYMNLFEHTDEMEFDYSTDLQDTGHLNDSGSGKVAAFLAEYIIENYGE